MFCLCSRSRLVQSVLNLVTLLQASDYEVLSAQYVGHLSVSRLFLDCG